MDFSMAARTHGTDVPRIIRPAISQALGVVRFEIWRTVLSLKWRRLAADIAAAFRARQDVRLDTTASQEIGDRRFRSADWSLARRLYGKQAKLLERSRLKASSLQFRFVRSDFHIAVGSEKKHDAGTKQPIAI